MGSVNPLPSLESLVHTVSKAVANPISQLKLRIFHFNNFAPASQHLSHLFVLRALLAGCSGLPLPRGLFVVFPRGGLFWPSREPFVVLVFRPPRVLRLFLPSLFCTTNSRFFSTPTPVLIPLLSCLLCDHTCLVLWCLYVVSPFLSCSHTFRVE